MSRTTGEIEMDQVLFAAAPGERCLGLSARPFASPQVMDSPPLSSAQSSRLLIVDGHAYAYRAFHAIRQLSSPTGAPTNAIYGFIKMLAKMEAFLEPSHRIVVWDGGLAAERLA